MALISDCIFCRIIRQEIPAKIIAQNNHVLVIQDITPKAPIHYLIIPKTHIVDIASLQPSDSAVSANMLFMAQQLSKQLPGSQSFRLIANNGRDSGQSVSHLHMHFLSGKQMHDF